MKIIEKKNNLFLILVLFLVFLIHLSYINNGFTWLDHGDIEGGRTVLPITQLEKAFFTRFGETNFYRPLVTVFNSVDDFIYKKNPLGFHLTNIFLLLSVTVASCFFGRTFFDLKQKESIFVAFLVGIHPLSILPVGVISYRQELLVVMFTFATLTAYIKARSTIKTNWYIIFVFFWLMALVSKETALFWVPALIFIWEWSRGFKNLRREFWYFTTFFLTTSVYIFLRVRAVPELWTKPGQYLNISEALGTRFSVFLTRLFELVNPFKPSFSDATLISDITNFKSLIMVFILTAGLVLILFSKKNYVIVRLILFILITLLPALSIVPLPRFSSSHYGFIATPAAGVMVILFLRFIFRSTGKTGKSIAVAVTGIWLLIMSVSTFKAGFQFKNDLSLFSLEVERDGNFKEGHFYLGDYYLRQGNFKEAEAHLEASLEKNPRVIAFIDRTAAMTNLAGAYFSQQKFAKAEKLLKELVIKSSGGNRLRAVYNLAVIAERKRDYKQVVNLLREEISQWQESQPILLYVKGLVKTGREAEGDRILKNSLLITDEQKRQAVLQEFSR